MKNTISDATKYLSLHWVSDSIHRGEWTVAFCNTLVTATDLLSYKDIKIVVVIHFYKKLPIQSMLLTCYKWDCNTKVKIKWSLVPNQKFRSVAKSVVSFYSFPVLLRGAFTLKKLPALKDDTKMKRDNKTASWNNDLDLQV